MSLETMLTGTQIRARYLEFFVDKGHLKIPSSSLVPRNDPTVLLTTAGMQQILPYFLGRETPPALRLTSVQKCFRTTDIDNVGNERSLTFFEMLGNFSVGDYFKREAISFAWELLTRVFMLPPDRLFVTVHPEDEEAARLWSEIAGFADAAITRLEDNWWGPPGASGPCGPDSEIYYDRGIEHGCGRADCRPGCECERFLEIWNLVFTQFYQDLDGKRSPLPKKNIDTGMGLERLCMVLQGKESVFDTDLFRFPLELTQEVAAEYGFTVDIPAFEQALQRQQERSRANTAFVQNKDDAALAEILKRVGPTEFTGYQGVTDSGKVVGLVVDGVEVDEISSPQSALVVLDATPFYAESGGQIGDRGDLSGSMGVFQVRDTQRPLKGLIVHYGQVAEGYLRIGDSVQASVNSQRREDTMRNHSATYLLHKALRNLLGPHLEQRGSLVEPERLRFDFASPRALTTSELEQIDEQINRWIRSDFPVQTNILPLQQALQTGAMALFGEKYEDAVRVVSMGSSIELCGGTHCSTTGQIGLYITIQETSVAAGIRRIEALTGRGAERYLRQRSALVDAMSATLQTRPEQLPQATEQLTRDLASARKQIAQFQREATQQQAETLIHAVTDVEGIPVVAAVSSVPDVKLLREMGDTVLRKLGKPGVVVLASTFKERVGLQVNVSSALTKRGLHAGKIANAVSQRLGGKGGGRPESAQGGSKNAADLGPALAMVADLVRQSLK